MTETKPHYIDSWTYTVYIVADGRDDPPRHIFLTKQEAEDHMKNVESGDAVCMEYQIKALDFLHFMSRDKVRANWDGSHCWYHCACVKDDRWAEKAYCRDCDITAGLTYEDGGR